MDSLPSLPAMEAIISSGPPCPMGHLRCWTQSDFRMALEVFILIVVFRHKGQVGFGTVQIHRYSLGDLGSNLPVMLCDTRARSRWPMAIKDGELCKQPFEGSSPPGSGRMISHSPPPLSGRPRLPPTMGECYSPPTLLTQGQHLPLTFEPLGTALW